MKPIVGYCVNCRGNQQLTETRQTQRSGVPTIAGKCGVCGSNVFVLGAHLSEPAAETTEGEESASGL